MVIDSFHITICSFFLAEANVGVHQIDFAGFDLLKGDLLEHSSNPFVISDHVIRLTAVRKQNFTKVRRTRGDEIL